MKLLTLCEDILYNKNEEIKGTILIDNNDLDIIKAFINKIPIYKLLHYNYQLLYFGKIYITEIDCNNIVKFIFCGNNINSCYKNIFIIS
jgi:hypothetical protein